MTHLPIILTIIGCTLFISAVYYLVQRKGYNMTANMGYLKAERLSTLIQLFEESLGMDQASEEEIDIPEVKVDPYKNYSHQQKHVRDTYFLLYGAPLENSIKTMASLWGQSAYGIGLIIDSQMPVNPDPKKTYKENMEEVLNALPNERAAITGLADDVMKVSRSINIASGEILAYLSIIYPKNFSANVILATQIVIYKDLGVDKIMQIPEETLEQLSNGDLVLIGGDIHQHGYEETEDVELKITAELRKRIKIGTFGSRAYNELRSIKTRLESFKNAPSSPYDSEGNDADKRVSVGVSRIIDHIQKTMDFYNSKKTK